MSVKSTLKTYKRAIILALKYPASQRFMVIRDYLYLYRTKGLKPDEYYDFEFEKQDEDFRKSFLGVNEQRLYVDYLNPIKYYSLSRNKYMTHKMLENTGVKKSELYCYYQPEARYVDSTENACDLISVLRILKQKNVQSCVIKTTESSHGDNVWVINSIEYQSQDAVLTRFDGEPLMLSSVIGSDALIFESVVHQTKQFATFNQSSVNTVRFMTTLYPDGSSRIIATWFKVGRSGRCVDNAGSGGNVDAAVDIDTGTIYNVFQFDGWRNAKKIEKHPDNGNQLNGVVIENWQAIKESVKKAQQAFPYCKAAGWDVAITDEGPVVIEVNDLWDRTGQYFIGKGWRKEIRDCYIAWRKYWMRGESMFGKISNTVCERQPDDSKVFLCAEGEEYMLRRFPNALTIEHLRNIAVPE